jgi:hypothetical protein
MYSFDLYILVYLCKFTVTLYIQKISCQDVQYYSNWRRSYKNDRFDGSYLGERDR